MMISSISAYPKVNFIKSSTPAVQFKAGTVLECDTFVHEKKSMPYPIGKLGRTFNRPIELFFSDIDDTIRRSDTKSIPESALKAIDKLKKAGIPLIYATGRCIAELDYVKDELPAKPDYYILEQGTQIIDKDYNIIYEDVMSAENTKGVIGLYEKLKTKDPNLYLLIYFDGIPYTTAGPEGVPENKKTFIKTVPSFDELLDSGLRPTKIVFFKKDSKGYKDLEPLQKTIKRTFADTALSCVLATTRYCEVFNRTSSKGNAVKIIAKLLNTEIENTAAIGDGGNDLDMINAVKNGGGVGIAMGNGMETLRENAGYVTSDIKDDGFALAVDQIIENNSRFVKMLV